jgi:hypothetical protein
LQRQLLSAVESVVSPKRSSKSKSGFDGLYPYYAGFSEAFAEQLISALDMPVGARILDPWNGSGTTTSSAARHGFVSAGFDINPVMVIVARARLLPASEASSLAPLSLEICSSARRIPCSASADDPLLDWFVPETANQIRSLERTIYRFLVSPNIIEFSPKSNVDYSSCASCLYMALFMVVRSAASARKSSNPTWIKLPRSPEEKIVLNETNQLFIDAVKRIAIAMDASGNKSSLSQINWADSSSHDYGEEFDLVLTSPPYCTRIDYAANSRIEMSVLPPHLAIDHSELRLNMIGTTRVPKFPIKRREEWGPTCNSFLQAVSNHPSFASATYYYKNHADYYDKLFRSFRSLSSAVKSGGAIIMVIQDSHYKDIHNDVPLIASEMIAHYGINLVHKRTFESQRCMSRLNQKAVAYRNSFGSSESILCFIKE